MSAAQPKVEVFTERAKLAAGREQTVDVLVRVRPPEVESGGAARRRLNLGVVLDRSGSMGGEKMLRAIEAASYCVDQLLPSDRLSVVIFDEFIEVLIPSRPVEDKPGLKRLLSRVAARGSTALHEAWVCGGMQVSEHLDSGAINRVLLITDGLANVGLTNNDEIVSQAKGLFERGVSTSTVGIGADFNEGLLMPMASAGGGNAWHVAEAHDMQRIFAVELEGLLAQFAHNVSLGLVPSDGVSVADLLNDFELTETGRYQLPDLQAGSPLDVVLRLHLPAQEAGKRMRLLDLRLGYTPHEARGAEVLKHAFEVEFAPPEEVERLSANPEVAKAVLLLMNARAKREAVAWMDRGDYAAASSVIGSAREATAALCAAMPADKDALSESEELYRLTDSLEDRRQDKMSRKIMEYSSYLRRMSRKSR
ncbi:MAG TPA: VWA domain-containing protein [Pyrinomonadaceae bacterium]|nr:VWA domain-containing protein [Pyrinomonadaceae bacterium]